MSLSTTAWTAPEHGALFVVTGASGTGKTTLVRKALQSIPGLRFSVSATTRPIRDGEVDGEDYHFIENEAFQAKVLAGEFLESAEVYGKRYGTLRAQVDTVLASGQSILLDIDNQGAAQVRASGVDHVSIFILPPSLAALSARLAKRATDSDATIARRIKEASLQLEACGDFDYLVVNDELHSAHDQFQAVLLSELMRSHRHRALASKFSG